MEKGYVICEKCKMRMPKSMVDLNPASKYYGVCAYCRGKEIRK